MESCFNAGLCTGIWPPWDLPELYRYKSLKLHTSNVRFLLLFYFPKPSRFCIGQGLCSCPGFGLFSLCESENLSARELHAVAPLYLRMLPCTLPHVSADMTCLCHRLNLGMERPCVPRNSMDTLLPCHGSALLPRCWALLTERE